MDGDRSVEEMVLENRRVGGVGGFQVGRDVRGQSCQGILCDGLGCSRYSKLRKLDVTGKLYGCKMWLQ